MSPQSPRVARAPLERVIQRHFFQWLSRYPSIRNVSFAIPNGGTRNLREAVSLKAQGVTSGVPDIFIAVPCFGAYGKYNGLFIELKSSKGRPSESQKEMIVRLRDNGYDCHICYSLDEAIKVATDYLGVRIRARSRTATDANHSARANGDESI